MSLTLLTLSSLVGAAFSQFPNGLNFGISNEVKPQQPQQPVVVPYIVNEQSCFCVTSGTACPSSNANGIDIRIVNTGTGSDTMCPAGWVWCCSGTNPSPPADRTCGIRKISPQAQPVVGQASFGAYPWQAALLNLQQDYLGSGVLLDSSHVLTAAHKVASFVNAPSTMLVRLGEWNIQSTSEPNNYQQYAVAKITIHPNFNPNNLDNDVAVIRLNGVVATANFPNINTACKPSAQPVAGSRCYVSGWGKNLFGPNGSYQSTIREVDVPILDGTDCENRLKQTRLGAAFTLNKNSFLCAGGESGKDACTGDGGSPLVCQNANGQWVVVGIVAWGIGCATINVPGVYTNVFYFLPWINQVIATQ